MLRFDGSNRLFWLSKTNCNYDRVSPFSKLSRLPLLEWQYIQSQGNFLNLNKNDKIYSNFELKLFISALIQDLQLFRDELLKDELMIGKFSFVQLDEIKKWRVELCSKPIPRIDIIYNNNEIQVIRSYISPEEYRGKVCLKYMF